MELVHLVLSLPPCSRCSGNGVVDERRRVIPPSESPGGGKFSGRSAITGLTKRLSPEGRATLSRWDFARRSTLKATEVENVQIAGLVEIPVSCYQVVDFFFNLYRFFDKKAAEIMNSNEFLL